MSTSPAPPSSRPVGFAAAALAVVLPLLVIAIPLARWSAVDPPASKSELVTRLERAVEKNPEVVVLGASKVGTDLDLPLLGRELGLRPDQVAGVNLSGTTAPVWYAVLDNRVFGTGKTPKLVIVYSTFDWTLATLPSGESERTILASQLAGDDPVLQRKTLGDDSNPTLNRIRLHRTETHTTLMGWIRDVSVGALLAKPASGQSVAQAGSELAAPALERLFGLGAAVDASRVSRAIPIVEAARATSEITAKRVEDTLLPDFATLASEHGARVVFVSAPVRRDAEIGIVYPPATARAAVQLLNQAGAGYTDLRDLALPDSAFGDATHLNKVGRDALTRALVERLKAMNAIGDTREGGSGSGIVPAKLPVVQAMPVATRAGAPPALPALEPKRGGGTCDWSAAVPGLNAISDSDLEVAGYGMVSPLRVTEDGDLLAANATRDDFAFRCGGASQHQAGLVKFAPKDGPAEVAASRSYALALAEEIPVRNRYGFQGWWVYPGTTLQLDFPEGWQSDAADPGFGVTLEALALAAPAQPGAVTMRVGDSTVTLAQDGLHRAAAASIAPPAGPWSIVIDAPADGGWVYIQRLRIGNAADTRVIIGQDGPTAVPALTAYASYVGADGKPDAPVLPAPGAFAPHEGNVAKADVAMLGVPDTDALWRVASVAGCSPLRLSEDGALLPNLVVRAQDVAAKGNGAYTQVGQTLYALGSDGSSPAQNGRAYTVALEPTRACRGLRWVYPGDTLTLKLTPNLLSRMLGGLQRLEIGSAAVVPEGAEPEARVVVKVGAEVRLETTFKLGMATPPSWTFDPPLPRGPEPVYVEVSLPADAPYVLLSSVAFSEPGAPGPGAPEPGTPEPGAAANVNSGAAP